MIELAQLTKTYGDATSGDAAVPVLEAVDLTIDAGEFVSIIGPSGCGKSTLLRIIGGLLDHSGGSVTVDGDAPDGARRHKRFGLVPQSPALLPWKSVRDNVNLLLDLNSAAGRAPLSPGEVDALLHRVGLAHAADLRPAALSGGMRQRVALARAFALEAPILLMDEPFSSLDELTRADMRYLLLELWEATRSTVVFVTHSIDEAVVLSDRVVVLGGSPGRVQLIETIDLERPRHEGIEDDERFRAHAAAIRAALHSGAAAR
ncbi:MAG: ABC transporter ATP-binding protein [Acidimicrobiales bacterium]